MEQLLATPNARHEQTWRVTLSPEQNALLRGAAAARDLKAFAAKHWIEHVVIGQPFGVLGMDRDGRVSWLQLETRAGLGALAELAEIEGVPAAGLEHIRAGRQLADLELRQALGREGPPQLTTAVPVGQGDSLLGALFTIEPPHSPDASNSYLHWLARQEQRNVQG